EFRRLHFRSRYAKKPGRDHRVPGPCNRATGWAITRGSAEALCAPSRFTGGPDLGLGFFAYGRRGRSGPVGVGLSRRVLGGGGRRRSRPGQCRGPAGRKPHRAGRTTGRGTRPDHGATDHRDRPQWSASGGRGDVGRAGWITVDLPFHHTGRSGVPVSRPDSEPARALVDGAHVAQRRGLVLKRGDSMFVLLPVLCCTGALWLLTGSDRIDWVYALIVRPPRRLRPRLLLRTLCGVCAAWAAVAFLGVLGGLVVMGVCAVLWFRARRPRDQRLPVTADLPVVIALLSAGVRAGATLPA